MASSFMRKIFGSRNDRQVKKYRKIVNRINKLESELESLSDEQLGAKTAEFRDRFSQGASLMIYCQKLLQP